MSTFFKTLLPLIANLDSLSIQISASDPEKQILTVSLLPRAKDVKDDAIQQIKPLVLRGSVEELDQEFLKVIAEPLQVAGGLFTNLKEFEAGVAKAKAESAIADKEKKEKKEREEKEKKQITANDTKADGVIVLSDELVKENKASEAIKKLTAFQESTPLLSEKKRKEVTDKIEAIRKATAQESLFPQPA